MTADNSQSVAEAMRRDWNARAREDAHYYVAFGRKNQDNEEFFETGREQVHGLELELRRLSGAPPYEAALEIGCGPGRLMLPMARHFREIHGVDVSDEMVARARENLRAAGNAFAHHAPASDLRAVAGRRFDFVYSYAVFQHIPSREVVMGYLREAGGLLKPGGILRAQLNGLTRTHESYTTWSGVRIAGEEIAQLARDERLQLLALEGTGTQYLWTTLRKPMGESARPAALTIRRITNAYSGEPMAPVSGRFAALSLRLEGLGDEVSLNDLQVEAAGATCQLTYLGPPEMGGLRQLNALLPVGLPSGITPVMLRHTSGAEVSSYARLIPAPPAVAKLLSVTDGIDLLSGTRIATGLVKATVEEVHDLSQIEVRVAGIRAAGIETFCTDPRLPKWEINAAVPAGVAPGPASVEVFLGARRVGAVTVEITAGGK